MHSRTNERKNATLLGSGRSFLSAGASVDHIASGDANYNASPIRPTFGTDPVSGRCVGVEHALGYGDKLFQHCHSGLRRLGQT